MMNRTIISQRFPLFLFRIVILVCQISLGSSYFACQTEAQNSDAQTQKIERDWTQYPAIIELDTKNELYVIGDIHGDYEGLLELLLASEIIKKAPASPEKVKWKAGKAVLVIPGDFISKGPRSVEVLQLLRKLQELAPKSGGQVILTFGNHEAEFLANPKESKVKMFRKELKERGISSNDVIQETDQLGIGTFLKNLPFAVRVNDWYFVHAGHPKKYSIQELEEKIIEGVENEGFGAPILLDNKKGILEVRMEPRPWWEKKKDNGKDSKSRLRNLVDVLGVNHIVVGHQPGSYSFADGETRKKGKMYQKFDGMIFFIDTGMESKKSDGAMLHIQKINDQETVFVIYPGKKEKKILWPKD